jgi:pyrroloquinoline quinone biosynthesis protein D
MAIESTIDLREVPEVSRRFRLQYEKAQSAWVLLYPEGMVKLSDSAAEIMKRLDGSRSVEALIRDLESAFAGADLQRDVLDFLQAARANGWITTRG